MRKTRNMSEGDSFALPLVEQPADLWEEEPLPPLPEVAIPGVPMHDDTAPLDPLTFQHELLTADEETQLAKEVEQGGERADRARKRFMRCNQRLVYSIASRYMGMGVALWDLIQEGNIGVARAVTAYDYRRGFRFSTYASWWIRQAITEAVRQQVGAMRIPDYIHEELKKLQRVTRSLAQELDHSPTVEDQARAMGMAPEKVAFLLEVRQYLSPAFSLSHVVNDEEGLVFGDILEDPGANVEEQLTHRIARQELVHEVQAILLHSRLKPRERLIVLLHLSGHSLEEIGASLPKPITRERVRQIEAKAYEKLRQMPELFTLWQQVAS